GGSQNTTAYVNITNNTFNNDFVVQESTNVRVSENIFTTETLMSGNHPAPDQSNSPSYNIIFDANNFTGNSLKIINMSNSTVGSNYGLSSIVVNESTNISISNNNICEGDGEIFLTSDSHNNTGDNTCDNVIDEDSNTVTCSQSCPFTFHGYTRYPNGTAMENTNVTVEIYNTTLAFQKTETYKGSSQSDGFFNISGISKHDNNENIEYKILVRHFNDSSYNFVDWIGTSLPALSYEKVNVINGLTFHLEPGATLNITAVNKTGLDKFQYILKDLQLGYPVMSDFANDNLVNRQLYAPKNRNYSLWMYVEDVNESSFRINSNDLQDGYFEREYNMSFSYERLKGKIDAENISGWDELSVTTFLVEPGRTIRYGGGDILYNASGNDKYNLTTGKYNVSILTPAEANQSIMAMYTAYNSTEGWYGGYKEYEVSYGIDLEQKNITLQPMAGAEGNLDVVGSGLNNINKTYPLINFTVLDSTGSRTTDPIHLEIEVDYSDFNMSNFTILAEIEMKEMAQGVSSYEDGLARIPVLNVSGIKNVNVFNKGTSPRKKNIDVSDLWDNNVDIQLENLFNMENPDGTTYSNNLYVDMVTYSSECNKPSYSSECSLLGGIKSAGNSELIKNILGGGRSNFVMKKDIGTSNITVIYINTDLMASGPPDAVFDNSSSSSSTSSTFEEAWKFGSNGPEIYDEVIIGVPYTEGSSSQTGFDESEEISMSINSLYGKNWTTPVWNYTDGDRINNISNADSDTLLSEFKDYIGSEFESYLNGSNVVCSSSDTDLTGLCYKDTEDNILWFKIKHFSGMMPKPSGTKYQEDSENGDEDDTTSGGTISGTTTEPTVSIPKQSKLWTNIEGNKTNMMKIDDQEKLGLVMIEFKLKNSEEDVKITIKQQKEKPDKISKNPGGKVYRYLHINTTNMDENNTEEVKLEFDINKSWIQNNSIDENKVYFKRYVNGKWEKYNTTKVSESADKITYSVKIPGFSYFAISGEEITVEDGEENVTETTTTTTIREGETEIKKEVTDEKGDILLYSLLLLGIIAIFWFAYFLTKKHHRI
ncbi:MAG: PGF-pre-PGF domain-containing protein, partial [Candidatus Aenigmatarchaeota archaeon]